MNILTMSISSGVLILAVMLIRLCMGGKLPRRLVLILWGIVALRLLVPFSLPFEYSVYSLSEQTNESPAPESPNTNENGFLNFPLDRLFGGEAAVPEQPPAPDIQPDNVTSDKSTLKINWIDTVYFGVWLALLCGYVIYCIVLKRRYDKHSFEISKTDSVYELLYSFGNRRNIKIMLSEKVNSPLTYGVIRPVILLPEGTNLKDTESLRCVLQHEYMHIKHLDIVWKTLAAVTLFVHWFNPLVWVMYFAFCRDVEIACDESVTKSMSVGQRKAYALALLDAEERRKSYTVFANSFGKNAVARRVKLIVKGTRRSVTLTVLSVLIVAVVFGLFATSSAVKANETPETPTTETEDLTTEYFTEIDKETGKSVVRWPEEILPENFPSPTFSEIYSVERKNGVVTIVLFCNYNPPHEMDDVSFIHKLLDMGYRQYHRVEYDALSESQYAINSYYIDRQGYYVTVVDCNDWNGEHLTEINKQSPTGYTYEIKVFKDKQVDCMFWSFPSSSTDLDLEQRVFDAWPAEELPEGFPTPDGNIKISEIKQERNGLFVTLKGDVREINDYYYKILFEAEFIPITASNRLISQSGYYMYDSYKEFDGVYSVTFQICPPNDLIDKNQEK